MISIITPSLNGIRYVAECLSNVRMQFANNHDQARFEHIVVDGGSSDGTLEYLRTQVCDNACLRVIHAAGSSQGAALNLAISHAKFELIGILNIDDLYCAGTVTKVLALYEQNVKRSRFLCGNCSVIDHKQQQLWLAKPRAFNLAQLIKLSPKGAHPINPAAYFYSKNLHDLVGGYDERDQFTLDLDFLMRALAVAEITYVDETWGMWRFIPGSKTFDSRRSIAYRLQMWRTRLRYLKNCSFSEIFQILSKSEQQC